MSEKMRILVVDDNEDFCHNVMDILELNGYEATAAHDGLQGLELLKQQSFDLVLMDVKMPVMNGVEAFKKAKEVAPGTPVIMVTAFSVEDLVAEALREGAYGSLKKPLDFDQLLALINDATTSNGMLILVADDDVDLCANIQQVLTDRGYRVSVVHDSSMAIERAQKNRFDVMLLDMKMPALNGLETYLAIHRFRPDVVVVAITGYQGELSGMVQKALQESVYTCMEKPLSMDNLISLLERIREQKDAGTIKKPQ